VKPAQPFKTNTSATLPRRTKSFRCLFLPALLLHNEAIGRAGWFFFSGARVEGGNGLVPEETVFASATQAWLRARTLPKIKEVIC